MIIRQEGLAGEAVLAGLILALGDMAENGHLFLPHSIVEINRGPENFDRLSEPLYGRARFQFWPIKFGSHWAGLLIDRNYPGASEARFMYLDSACNGRDTRFKAAKAKITEIFKPSYRLISRISAVNVSTCLPAG